MALMQSRSWRWLRMRIVGLLETPPDLAFNGRGLTVSPRTRIGWALDPPKTPEE